MDPLDVRAYLGRDWTRVQKEKERFWAERKARMSPVEALRVGSDLWRHARALRPDWPSDEEREEDWATHARVSEMLRCADARTGS